MRGDRALRVLTWLMFLVTAMTTSVVGVLIPDVARTYGLSLAQAGGLQYAVMAGVALAGLLLGGLADRLGRRATVLAGLALFTAAASLIPLSRGLPPLLALLFVSGLAIGLFKTGALALIGDLSDSSASHARSMNVVEGVFAVGAIIGPMVVARLLANGLPWTALYGLAGALSLSLLAVAALVRFPPVQHAGAGRGAGVLAVIAVARAPRALGYAGCVFLYVGVETAVYVWMPSLLAAQGAKAPLPGAYALSTFFVLRALGRFLGAWALERLGWTRVLAACSAAILVCFVGALAGGLAAASTLLPLSGLFMSVLYPTLNAKAINGFPPARQGAAAGFMLFATCLSATLSPLAIGATSDAFGGPRAGFVLAAGMALALAVALAVLHARQALGAVARNQFDRD
ncbi:sugar MFS transporter [uncultured Caulobacter sp.]|uniref:MFS transporter n=1 Tax=uncultured Caulobacter sp. TaxID=158749 RepID=UPI0026295B2A|nr:MFS transporter [uncultured Caulobacter sp.]